MIRLICLATLFLFLSVPVEAIASKVYYVDSEETIETLAKTSALIVVVKNLNQTEIYRKELIPIKVNGKPGDDYEYQEVVQLFEVVSILKPHSTVAVGETIKMWTEPNYDYEMTKNYYQTGVSKSPMVRRYNPMVTPAEGENLILFLGPKAPEKDVYQYQAMEGVTLLPHVEEAILKGVEQK